MSRYWEEKRLEQLSREEWEGLCDGCGKCCLHKLEDEETGDIYPTNVACRLLDRKNGLCRDYKNRRTFVPDCVRLTPAKLGTLEWLPSTCAYRLVAEGKPLPDWHYLISGSRETVHQAKMSTRGWTVSEDDAGELEYHIVDREL
jgi:uncharacterized cysteine cluster protein YcgN (CxxCxxCC family)